MTADGDPGKFPPEARVAEVAALLGKAYLRLLVARKESQKALAEPPQSEAPCDRVVDATGKEST